MTCPDPVTFRTFLQFGLNLCVKYSTMPLFFVCFFFFLRIDQDWTFHVVKLLDIIFTATVVVGVPVKATKGAIPIKSATPQSTTDGNHVETAIQQLTHRSAVRPSVMLTSVELPSPLSQPVDILFYTL